MLRPNATVRLAFALVCLVTCSVLAAHTLGVTPDWRSVHLLNRAEQCKAIAVCTSLLTQPRDAHRLEAALQTITDQSDDIQSITVRKPDGRIMTQVGAEADHVNPLDASILSVPIFSGDDLWAMVEVTFPSLSQGDIRTWGQDPQLRLLAFIATVCFTLFYLFLRRTLQHLNPSKVVPSRVRSALDTITSGVLIMDEKERIVLANKALAETVHRTTEDLLGAPVATLPWRVGQDGADSGVLPWRRTLAQGEIRIGDMLAMSLPNADDRTFLVNSAPIQGTDQRNRGVLISLDDVTALEKKKAELARMLHLLQDSREEVCRQNEELKLLATIDPLTLCMNRRSFFESFGTAWTESRHQNRALGCVMVDVDFFKSINDNYGHAAGDEALRTVAEILRKTARKSDLVCRYGGEEFCVLLPGLDIDDTAAAAERLRSAIAAADFPHGQVTASLGVTAASLGAADPQQLLDQADQSLYFAKRNGRNRVARWDNVAGEVSSPAGPDGDAASVPAERAVSIPFQAVTALFSALAYRDPSTGEHSRRVADRCVATAKGLLSQTEIYVLEIAALLHDIGKIGVPDSILLKPGGLTKEEWQIMEEHTRIGVEIVRAAFCSERLTQIVLYHHAWYAGLPQHADLPSGEAIPIEARILTIADAYDAMTSERPYKPPMSREAAFAELRRCAGTQFDPQLVERFIERVAHLHDSRQYADTTVSRQTALQLGLEIERLAMALDARDLNGLRTLATQIKGKAQSYGLPTVGDLTGRLEHSLNENPDLAEILETTHELLELCRDAQNVDLRGIRRPLAADRPPNADAPALPPVTETAMSSESTSSMAGARA